MSTLGESESQTCSWHNLSCTWCIKVMSHRHRASSLPIHTYKAFRYVMSFLHLIYGSSVREMYQIAKFLVHFSEVLVLPAHALQQANSLPTFVTTLQVDKTSRRDTIVTMKHAIVLLLALLMVLIISCSEVAVSYKLDPSYYSSNCADVLPVVKSVVVHVMQQEAWMGAQLLRLHFHDCFVNVWFTWSHDFLKFMFGTISCVYVCSEDVECVVAHRLLRFINSVWQQNDAVGVVIMQFLSVTDAHNATNFFWLQSSEHCNNRGVMVLSCWIMDFNLLERRQHVRIWTQQEGSM